MAKKLKRQAFLVLAVTVISLIYLAPSISNNLPQWWKNKIDKIHLGLDLQGGMHLFLEVEVEKAVESTVERIAQDIKDALMKNNIPFLQIERVEGTKLLVRVIDRPGKEGLDKILNDNFPDLKKLRVSENEGDISLKLELDERQIKQIERLAVDQGIETIRNRIDQFGVTEPTVQRQGKNRILIQLPGIEDPQRAKELVGKTALLEFKLVDEKGDLSQALKGNIVVGSEILYQKNTIPETGEIKKTPFLIKKKTLMTGDLLTDARISINSQFNEPYVSITFNKRGSKTFERITGAHVRERLAIILDGNVYSAPVIQEKISGGRAQISGRFTEEEARDLAIVLRAGSLPAPVKILEERTVGPSLGKDSINKGVNSIIVGGILVVAFMVIYYLFSGVIANIALILNLVIIMGVLAAFKATLTLPGIAGIVLIIGMAVDANVLILERIREELRLGKTPRVALDGGYSKAFLTIVDANITTLIAAIVLFQFGTGPIKGFAVTLSIGIIASMFTALFVTRIIFDYLFLRRGMKKISI